MFVTMISVGVIVAKFRHDWEHHTDAGESYNIDRMGSQRLRLTILGQNRMGRHRSHLDLRKFVPSSPA